MSRRPTLVQDNVSFAFYDGTTKVGALLQQDKIVYASIDGQSYAYDAQANRLSCVEKGIPLYQGLPPDERGGIICISESLMQLLGISIGLADVQGRLRDSGIFDTVKKALLLPESYHIHGIFYNAFRRVWELVVEGPNLPIVYEAETLPVVMPIYSRFGEEPQLVCIETEQAGILSDGLDALFRQSHVHLS